MYADNETFANATSGVSMSRAQCFQAPDGGVKHPYSVDDEVVMGLC